VKVGRVLILFYQQKGNRIYSAIG